MNSKRDQLMEELELLEANEEILVAVKEFIDEIEREVNDIKDNLNHRAIGFMFDHLDEAFTGITKLSEKVY